MPQKIFPNPCCWSQFTINKQTNSRTRCMVAVRINSFLWKTELAGNRFPVEKRLKKAPFCFLWHRLWNTAACPFWSLLFQVIYLRHLSVQPNTCPQKKANSAYNDSQHIHSYHSLVLPNIFIFPFPLSFIATHWLFAIVLIDYIHL